MHRMMAAVPFLVAGCDARVDAFSASAHYLCKGQQVQLAWRVTGSASMKSEPPLVSLPDGPVSDDGHATVRPTETTRIQLHVTRFLGDPTSSTQELRVLADSPTPEPLTGSIADPSAGCSDGKVWVTIKAQRFSPTLKVATVAAHAGDARTYDVAHAGVHARIEPGAVAADFAGLPIAGDWVLTSPLATGEACGTSALPRSLNVDVFTQCNLEGMQ